VVQSGTTFSVSAARVTVAEGKSVTLTATAGGAQKLYWVVQRNGQETVVAVDRFAFTLDVGRVVGDTDLKVLLRAVYPTEMIDTSQTKIDRWLSTSIISVLW